MLLSNSGSVLFYHAACPPSALSQESSQRRQAGVDRPQRRNIGPEDAQNSLDALDRDLDFDDVAHQEPTGFRRSIFRDEW